MRQLLFSMFITNTRSSFHMSWKKNLVKRLVNLVKVSKNYENDFLQNFLFLSMSLLTAKIGIYFIFLKNSLKQTWKSFHAKLQPQWKDQQNSFQVRQILALFCNFVALILHWKCLKGLRVTEIVKEINFEGVWGKVAKICFQKQGFLKYFTETLAFMWKSALEEKINFYFSGVFFLFF